MSLLQVGVDLALEADAAAVAAKSRALGALFQRLMAAECACFGFRLASPGRPEQRGSQICYGHPEGYAIVQVPQNPNIAHMKLKNEIKIKEI
jgi:kynureninase